MEEPSELYDKIDYVTCMLECTQESLLLSGSSLPPPLYVSDPTLPPLWTGVFDGTIGRMYYWNPQTNVSQYEKPVPIYPYSTSSTPLTTTPTSSDFSTYHSFDPYLPQPHNSFSQTANTSESGFHGVHMPYELPHSTQDSYPLHSTPNPQFRDSTLLLAYDDQLAAQISSSMPTTLLHTPMWETISFQ
ncbi:hypothetical protein ACE6H2_020948 [Prunus campanulata]